MLVAGAGISGAVVESLALDHPLVSGHLVKRLMCTTTNYSGSVEWGTEVQGTYDHVPALGTTQLTLHAVTVTSPEYIVTFTTPGCPDQDNSPLLLTLPLLLFDGESHSTPRNATANRIAKSELICL